ncbi:GNAT family N-acetyltransferase [Rhizocola hellebori]|uniref:GNAT family N-acetyltransferase n=1 Tax=Rhizocola hellebori TaxID=1392758 RepID=UPI00194275E4|nr:GNAT family N-acetyltransferase [Rhizocola hellebori]
MIDVIVEAHEARFRELDPLLPRRDPLPDSLSGQMSVMVDGAVGYPRRIRVDADSSAADWSVLDQHRLVARVGGLDPVAAMDALLTGWVEVVHAIATPEDRDSAATIGWPSRDTAMTPLFIDRGMIPLRVMAVRQAGRPGPDVASPATIRPMADADLDAVVALHLEQIRWDRQFGGPQPRPGAAEVARRQYSARLQRGDPWVWIAECDGRPVGMIAVTPPESAGWVAGLSSASTPAYVGTTVVLAPQRAGGVGTALVARAHAALDREGVDLALLHYSSLNPLSAPFWHRCGYRPLWSWWSSSPASRLRL